MTEQLFKIVAATQSDEQQFEVRPLGKSISKMSMDRRVFFDNREGLAFCYNQAIRELKDPAQIVVFVHDDVHFFDFFWKDHLIEGLKDFDLVGVAGNTRRFPRQSRWHLDEKGNWDTKNLSGAVAHGDAFPFEISWYGPPRQCCMLLDGVLLATRAKTLMNGLSFDPRFSFHFYDIDFCREAERRSLKMGTAAVSIAHEGKGNREGWEQGYRAYLDKWGS